MIKIFKFYYINCDCECCVLINNCRNKVIILCYVNFIFFVMWYYSWFIFVFEFIVYFKFDGVSLKGFGF